MTEDRMVDELSNYYYYNNQNGINNNYQCNNSFSQYQSILTNFSSQENFNYLLTDHLYKQDQGVITQLKKKSKTKAFKQPNDRFIPNRKGTNTEEASFYLSSKENNFQLANTQTNSNVYNRLLADTLINQSQSDETEGNKSFRLMKYNNEQQQLKNITDSLTQTYDRAARNQESQKITHQISSQPEKILDAPDLLDDYYLNLMDWGNNGILAVCLNQSVYLWNSRNGEIQLLLSTNQENNYVSSVSWMNKGEKDHLAIGFANNVIQLWDVEKFSFVRQLLGHNNRVSSLSWNNYILSSGSRDQYIINHDIRSQQNIISKLEGHKQEVCGLKWSLDGSLLASGGNDNNLMIWDLNFPTAKHCFTEHQAAVKALAWCPFQRNLLASGGGTQDKTMKFWNVETGQLIKSVNAESQVCSIVWSKFDKELISSHGYSKNQLCVWKYPSMQKVTELHGHQNRVLHLGLSPDGTTVCSAASDETLRFWRVFDPPEDDYSKTKRIQNLQSVNYLYIRQREQNQLLYQRYQNLLIYICISYYQ